MNTNTIKEYNFLNSIDNNLIQNDITEESSLLVNIGDFPIIFDPRLPINKQKEIPDLSDRIQETEQEKLKTITDLEITFPSPSLYSESIEIINPQLNNVRYMLSPEEEDTHTNESSELSISSVGDIEPSIDNEIPINSSSIINSSEIVLDPDRENISLLNQEDITDNNSPQIEETPGRFDPIYRFQNTEVPGTYIYVNETERQSVLENFTNFEEEGLAFRASVEPADFLIPIYRLQSTVVPGTYLFTGEEERNSVNENFADSFVEEGIAFYVYAPGSAPNSDLFLEFSRFQNIDIPGTYLYATGEERNSVREDFPNFFEEGIAFEAFDFLS